VARIEAGAFVVRPSLEELGPILEEARDDFRDQAERKGVELLVDPFSSELSARVDRDRIIQALANLLDNAIRLTPEGGCVVLGLRDDVDEVAITVSDTGPGIAPKLLDHLFDRFAQVDQVGKGGAGLGLAIVKGVAEAHDGTVNVESRLGVGTTFALAIPKAGPPLGEEGLPIEVSVARA
jgi:signal transduction histidine kinase